MPALDVSICSDALLLLGAGTISSFADGTDKATVAGNLYGGIRDALLVAYPWRFTMRKAQLARETAQPASEWRWQFRLPAESLRLRQLCDSPAIGAPPLLAYELFDGRALCNAEAVWADFQYRPAEAAFPPYFALLLKYALAADFAHAIVESDSKAAYWNAKAFGSPGENLMGGYFAAARALDAQQQPPQAIADFTLIQARLS